MPQLKFWLQRLKNRYFCALLLTSSLTCLSLYPINSATAQITPDQTLGSENSTITPDTIKGIPSQRIDGGAIRGTSLFHSFQEFNVREGTAAYFTNPSGIENILTRVSGNNVSNILGTLGVLGNANLLLMNPHGIVFGENARLDIGGSFLTTTANSLVLKNGWEFSTTNPEAPPLLQINVPLGLQLRSNPLGNIANAGKLAVKPGESLSFWGSTVTSTGSLIAPGGMIQLLGERVGLFDHAQIDVSGNTGGGTVLIGGDFQGQGSVPNAVRTYIGPDVKITADANSHGNGGKVIVWADAATGFYGEISARGGSVVGNGGFVEVSAQENLIFRGKVDTNAINGWRGTLLIDPTNIIIANGSGDQTGDRTDTFTGSILSEPLSQINDTAPTTIYESDLEALSGDTNIILQATNNITLQNLADNSLNLAAGKGAIAFTADADQDGVGNFVMEDNISDTINTNGRDLIISGASLQLGNINTSYINTTEFTALEDPDADELLATAQVINARTSVTTISSNLNQSPSSGGNYKITLTGVGLNNPLSNGSMKFIATNGSISTGNLNTASLSGTAGNISLDATRDITFNASKLDASGITAGNVTINSQNVSLTNGSVINVMGGSDGNIIINGQKLDINSDSKLLAGISTYLGSLASQAGDIRLNSTGEINLANGFVINSVAPQATGKGGNIYIQAGSVSLSDGSQLGTLTVGQGDTGSVFVQANNSISLSGLNTAIFSAVKTGFPNSSGIFPIVNVFSEAVGNSGDVYIQANSVFLSDGAQLIASTFGRGNSGTVFVQANDCVVLKDEYTAILSTVGFNTLGQIDLIVGNSGGISIQARSVSLSDGAQLFTGTFEKGNPGIVFVQANDLVSLKGEGTGIFSIVESIRLSNSMGDSSGIKLQAGSISLSDGAQIIASTFGQGNAGNISLQVDNTVSLEGGSLSYPNPTNASPELGGVSLVFPDGAPNLSLGGATTGIFSTVESLAKGNAGDIDIQARFLSLTGGAEVQSLTRGEGKAGNIRVNVLETINLSGVAATLGEDDQGNLIGGASSGLISSTETGAIGVGGDIEVTTNELRLANGAVLNARTRSEFTGGNITINANTLEITGGGQVLASSFGNSNAGNINVNVADSITVSGSDRFFWERLEKFSSEIVDNDGPASGLFARAQAAGNAGNLEVSTSQLRLEEGAQISAFSLASQGGNITLNNLDSLEVINSLISVSTANGKAGSLQVNGSESVNLRGLLAEGTPGGLLAAATADGTAGNLSVNTSQFNISDGAQATVSSNQGQAGNLEITANSLFLDQGQISAETFKSTVEGGANIKLQISDWLQMKNDSQISATARENANGGNINIDTKFLIAFPVVGSQGSDIIAKATFGNGGRININTQGIFGIQEQKAIASNRTNDIDASSDYGLSGEVQINGAIDPSQGLAQLPTQPSQPQLSQGCQASAGENQNEFIITGRGGLPLNPREFLTSQAVDVDWVSFEPVQTRGSLQQENIDNEQNATFVKNQPHEIVEAQALVVDAKGNINLVAQPPSTTPHSSGFQPVSCPAS
jgi:filamentous hemagglutinin family protein